MELDGDGAVAHRRAHARIRHALARVRHDETAGAREFDVQTGELGAARPAATVGISEEQLEATAGVGIGREDPLVGAVVDQREPQPELKDRDVFVGEVKERRALGAHLRLGEQE